MGFVSDRKAKLDHVEGPNTEKARKQWKVWHEESGG